MRTTLDINDALLSEAKAMAVREHSSLTRLIEEGLALRLRSARQVTGTRRPALPVYDGAGGLHPAIADPASNRTLLDAADEIGSS